MLTEKPFTFPGLCSYDPFRGSAYSGRIIHDHTSVEMFQVLFFIINQKKGKLSASPIDFFFRTSPDGFQHLLPAVCAEIFQKISFLASGFDHFDGVAIDDYADQIEIS